MGMLDGKVAIITGATSGIGARPLLDEQFRRRPEGETLQKKIGRAHV